MPKQPVDPNKMTEDLAALIEKAQQEAEAPQEGNENKTKRRGYRLKERATAPAGWMIPCPN